MEPSPIRVMFVYWGRRGLTQLTREVAAVAMTNPRLRATISVSRQNEGFASFQSYGDALFAVDTFASDLGALGQAWRIPLLRRAIARRIKADRIQAVVELMPHIWSSFVATAIRDAGAQYVTIVHDAEVHPGDQPTGLAKRLLDRAVRHSDRVIVLSEGVALRLVASGSVRQDKLLTLFHPELRFGQPFVPTIRGIGSSLRLLFLGRIMPYKGLPLFLDTVDLLRAHDVSVSVGVFGEGDLGDCAARLRQMGAEVVNRWLSDAEIAAVLARFDVAVLSHVEASQSGIAAMALGAGLPVVATPVGGLVEQVSHRWTGIVAERADAPALAEAVELLLHEPGLYQTLLHNISMTREQRSVARFVDACIDGL